MDYFVDYPSITPTATKMAVLTERKNGRKKLTFYAGSFGNSHCRIREKTNLGW
jgi:hypothetical protein